MADYTEFYELLIPYAREFGLDTTLSENGHIMVHPPQGDDRLVNSLCIVRAWHAGGMIIENLEKKELFDLHDPKSMEIIKRWFQECRDEG